MNLELGLTDGPFNTKFAPLAVLGQHWRRDGSLTCLDQVIPESGRPDFPLASKLLQVLSSQLAGCEYLCEVNSRLRSEPELARAWGFERYLEQSSLATSLNDLSRMNLAQLEQASQAIWRLHSRAMAHDWRGLLYLELDLSGLPCGSQAEASEKGYFSGKKTPRGGN